MTVPTARPPTDFVACLCAAWCGTCASYTATFRQAAAAHPDQPFLWVDIEDEADLLGPAVDVDNFPTLLVVRGGRVRFFGTLTPQPATLARLLQDRLADGAAPMAVPAEIEALATLLPPHAQRLACGG